MAAWLFWAAVILGLAAASFLSFVAICILDPPKTREGWRRELANTRGVSHVALVVSYMWLKGKGKEDERTGENLFGAGGASSASTLGGGHDRVLSKRPRSSNHRELSDGTIGSGASASRGGESPDEKAGLRPDTAERNEAPGADSSGSAPSSGAVQGVPSNSHPSPNSSTSGRGRGERADAGGADEEDEYDSEFWKALVRRGKAMGI